MYRANLLTNMMTGPPPSIPAALAAKLESAAGTTPGSAAGSHAGKQAELGFPALLLLMLGTHPAAPPAPTQGENGGSMLPNTSTQTAALIETVVADGKAAVEAPSPSDPSGRSADDPTAATRRIGTPANSMLSLTAAGTFPLPPWVAIAQSLAVGPPQSGKGASQLTLVAAQNGAPGGVEVPKGASVPHSPNSMSSAVDQSPRVGQQNSGAAPSQPTSQAHPASHLPIFARPPESDGADAIQSVSSFALHTSATLAVSSIATLPTMQGAQGEPGNRTAQDDKENSAASTMEIGSSEPATATFPSNPTSQKSAVSNVEMLTAAIRSNLSTLQQTGHVSIRLDLNPPELGPVADAGVTLGHVNLRHEGDGAHPDQQNYPDDQPRQNASTKNLSVRKSSSADSRRGGIDLIA